MWASYVEDKEERILPACLGHKRAEILCVGVLETLEEPPNEQEKGREDDDGVDDLGHDTAERVGKEVVPVLDDPSDPDELFDILL